MKDLLFVIGRIRALEGRAATLAHYERMVDASNADEAFGVMADLQYADNMTAQSTVSNYGELIDASLEDARDLISAGEVFPQMKLLWLKYDLGNLKSALNYVRAESDIPAFTRENGFEPLGDLDAEVLDDVFVKQQANEALSPAMQQATMKAINAETDMEADKILTKAYFAELMTLSKKFRNPFIKEYRKQHIDGENMRNVCRSMLTLNRKLTEDEFYAGGSFDYNDMESITDYNDLRVHFRGTKFEKMLPEMQASKSETMASIELSLISGYYDFLTHAEEGEIDSLQIPLAYFEKFLHQSNLIRYIFVGKLSGVPNESIKTRIRNLAIAK